MDQTRFKQVSVNMRAHGSTRSTGELKSRVRLLKNADVSGSIAVGILLKWLIFYSISSFLSIYELHL